MSIPCHVSCSRVWMILLVGLIASACSFKSTQVKNAQKNPPDLIFSDANITRYQHAQPILRITAKTIEVFSSDQRYAGESVSFTQFDQKTKQSSVTGATELLRIDEKRGEIFFGKKTFVQLLERNLTLRGANFMWQKNNDLFVSAKDEPVSIEQGEQLRIEGRGFVANTRTQAFAFLASVNGYVSPEQKPPTEQE